MKVLIKKILQKCLGFHTYLFVFALFCIKRLKWDRKERDFLHFLKMVPNRGTVLDIGANIGIMTVHLAKKLKDSKILAFEPNPDNNKILQRILRYYGLKNTETMEIALSDHSGNITMIMPVIKNVKMQGLCHVSDDNTVEHEVGVRFNVATKTLDEIAPSIKNAPVVAIKIDVENHEYQVFNGAENLLRKDMPLIYCELWENENRTKCIQLLEGLGYSTHVLAGNGLVKFDQAIHKQQNFFFINGVSK